VELERALRGDNPDDFHILVARTMLQRGRLRALESCFFEWHMEG
jgi:hypothetical protein